MATKFELRVCFLAQAMLTGRSCGAVLMKNESVAFIFTQAPHGNSAGREGLDALLATSALTENIGVFLSDGVFNYWKINSLKAFFLVIMQLHLKSSPCMM